MKIRVTYIATIDDQVLIDNDIALDDVDAIQDYFYEFGGEDAFHDHGENFELLG